jgi:YkoY family integral membrane protein
MNWAVADLGTIGLLIFLEGVLSIDNAVVLALLASRLPKGLQRKALTYGIIGAIGFRVVSLMLASHLMRWTWVKFAGGAYLLYVGGQHWVLSEEKKAKKRGSSGAMTFWKTVVMIELTDIAFAVDSILAAVAVSNKLWVVFSGGVLGMILMRFAASVFIRLLDTFPAFEDSAYLLIVVIGTKLVLDGLKIPGVEFHSSSSPASWVFWMSILLALAVGFRKKKKAKKVSDMLKTEADLID